MTCAAGVGGGASGPAARLPGALLVQPPTSGARSIRGLCCAPGAGRSPAEPPASGIWALSAPPPLASPGGSGSWPRKGGWGGEAGEAAPGASPRGPAAEVLVVASAAVAGGRARALAVRGPGVHLAQGSLPPGGAIGRSPAGALASDSPASPAGPAGGGCSEAGAEEASAASGGGGGRRGRQAAAPPAQGSAVKNGSGEEPEGVALAGPGWEASPIRTPRYPPHPGRGVPQLEGRGPGSGQRGADRGRAGCGSAWERPRVRGRGALGRQVRLAAVFLTAA